MINKPKILIFIDWFTPGFKAGGPIKSISNIVNSLYHEFDFYIITSDRDIDDKTPYKNQQFNQWIKKTNYHIVYLSEIERKLFVSETLEKNEYSKIYFNSLYSKNYTLEPIQLIKKLKVTSGVIIAPRGMLGKGALKIKPIKKKVFLILTKNIGFFKEVTWHATDREESKDIKKAFGKKSQIITTPNISILNFDKKEISKTKNELQLVFFSRISPKKNLFYTLEILKKIDLQNLTLTIYGTLEDENYWKKCQEFITENKLNVQYLGELNPNQVNNTLSNYHLLFFPTLHENYGHVIVEALTAGCGLIISTNTPWRALNRINVGWDINLTDSNKFIEVIKGCYNMNQEEYNTIRNNCYEFIKTEIEKQNAVELTKKMFLQ
ncbi:MAG: glycosyltransferase [Flavobacteriales bacterium]|nr:glycosyltransferase [Flavobacteriales bacterium]